MKHPTTIPTQGEAEELADDLSYAVADAIHDEALAPKGYRLATDDEHDSLGMAPLADPSAVLMARISDGALFVVNLDPIEATPADPGVD